MRQARSFNLSSSTHNLNISWVSLLRFSILSKRCITQSESPLLRAVQSYSHRSLFEQNGGQKQVLLEQLGTGTMATLGKDVDVRRNE